MVSLLVGLEKPVLLLFYYLFTRMQYNKSKWFVIVRRNGS
jgi:hypothetical protein